MRCPWPVLVLVAACASPAPAPIAPAIAPAAAPVAVPAAVETSPVASPVVAPIDGAALAAIGLDPDALDRSVDPCDDFYQFACGGWIQHAQIPADQPSVQRADPDVAWAHDLLERAARAPGSDPGMKQLGAFYRSCMDEAEIDKAGLAPLRPLLGAIERVKDARSLTTAIAALHAAGVPAVFALDPVPDPADARRVIAQLDQVDLGLPDRDYYLLRGPGLSEAGTAYTTFAAAALAALGHPAAVTESGDVYQLETELARLARDPVARRDPHGSDNKLSRGELAAAMPHVDWDAYWTEVGLPRLKALSVTSRPLLGGIDGLIASIKPQTWRAYLAVQLVRSIAGALPKPFEELEFQLRATMTGQPELPPRWKRCVALTEAGLGDLIGPRYVHDHLGPTGEITALIAQLSAAMTASLDALDWMDDATRDQAKAKLAAITAQVGAPRRWRSDALKLDAHAWTSNALAARKAARARQLARIDRPSDRDAWTMAVTRADAAYDPQRNALVCPAGLLRPPFYSPQAALPVNFGALGAVLGHELTHALDDQGAQYDAAGNLADWWQPHTVVAFRQRAQCVIEQYGQYDVDVGPPIDGFRTAGENLADIGGVKLAFTGYQLRRGAVPRDQRTAGFTEDQQFFLGFGQMWCAKLRPDYERLQRVAEVHAPVRWRVDGALAATPAFAAAFRCAPGAKMAPAPQCVVW